MLEHLQILDFIRVLLDRVAELVLYHLIFLLCLVKHLLDGLHFFRSLEDLRGKLVNSFVSVFNEFLIELVFFHRNENAALLLLLYLK